MEIIGLKDKQLASNVQFSSCCDEPHVSTKWMSSKMRIMRKFLSSDQDATAIKPRRRNRQRNDQRKRSGDLEYNSGSSNIGGIIRVCSDCKTTKTPLWRSGPLGPKSLCNACGIKQRKARKALHEAAAISGRAACTGKPKKNAALFDVDCSVPFKKRCRFITAQTAQRKLSFEDVVLSLNKSLLAFNLVFPQDEKDAAILLMALSCGSVCSL